MNYIVLDLEWNQPLSREKFITEPVKLRGEIVQIGAAKLDEDFNTVDTFKIMISPIHYKIMNRKVMELTGIHTSDIKRGYSFPTAYRLFVRWCGNEHTLLTWGCDDLPMLRDNLILHGIDPALPQHYDIQPIFDSQITNERRQCSLTYAMEVLGEPPFVAHDALNDALSAAVICRHLDMHAGFNGYADITRSSKLPSVKKSFARFSDILSDDEVKTLVCPECRKLMNAGDWVSCRRGKLMGLSDCECGEKYYTYVYCMKSKQDGSYRVTRKISKREERDEEYYGKKRLQNEEWQRKKAHEREYALAKA